MGDTLVTPFLDLPWRALRQRGPKRMVLPSCASPEAPCRFDLSRRDQRQAIGVAGVPLLDRVSKSLVRFVLPPPLDVTR